MDNAVLQGKECGSTNYEKDVLPSDIIVRQAAVDVVTDAR